MPPVHLQCVLMHQVSFWVSREQPHPDNVALKVAPLDGHASFHKLPSDLVQVLCYVLRVPTAMASMRPSPATTTVRLA